MRFLGVGWNEILDVPEVVIDCAFDNWMAEREANLELAVSSMRGAF